MCLPLPPGPCAMRKTLCALLLLLGLGSFFQGAARGGNWERFRGPNGTGIAADKTIPVQFNTAENVVWKLRLPGRGNSSPVVWGKNLFLQTASADGAQRLLLCIDVTTGKQVWARGIPGAKSTIHAK